MTPLTGTSRRVQTNSGQNSCGRPPHVYVNILCFCCRLAPMSTSMTDRSDAVAVAPPRPRISTTDDDILPGSGSSDDVPTPRAEWNPHLQPHRSDMDYLSPHTAPQRSNSNKGKGRSLDIEEDGAYGYEAYQEPEYLTVRPHPQRNRSGESERPLVYPDDEPRRGTYEQPQGDLEMGMDSVGNREGLGAMELGNGAGVYPPVSEEDAEERRIKEVSMAFVT